MSTPFHTSSDAATAQVQPCGGTADRPNLIITTTILASSLAFIDGSVVNVGLPAIGADFHAGASELQWVVNAYLLPLSALLLLGGRGGRSLWPQAVADRGRRAVRTCFVGMCVGSDAGLAARRALRSGRECGDADAEQSRHPGQ